MKLRRHGLIALAAASAFTAFVGAGGQPRIVIPIKVEPIEPRQPSVPCRPEGPPAGMVTVTPTGVVVNDPNIELLADEVVSQPMDVGSELPQLLSGTDNGLQEG